MNQDNGRIPWNISFTGKDRDKLESCLKKLNPDRDCLSGYTSKMMSQYPFNTAQITIRVALTEEEALVVRLAVNVMIMKYWK
jgi:hypothetical protein